MPVNLRCTCGRQLQVQDQLAGKRIRCPSCRAELTAPALADDDELVTLTLAENEPLDLVAMECEPIPGEGDAEAPWSEIDKPWRREREPELDPTETDAHNAEAIAGLRKKRLRRRLLLVGGIAWVVLGGVCPCALSPIVFRFAGPTWSQNVALSALLLPIGGVALTVVMCFDFPGYRRSLALAEIAESLKLRFTHRAAPQQIAFLRQIAPELIRASIGDEGSNLMEGRYNQRRLTSVDYGFVHSVGNRPVASAQTVVAFTEGFERFPELLLIPKGWWSDKLRNAITGMLPVTRFEVRDEPELNRLFVVAGKPRAEVLQLFTPEFVDLVVQDDRTSVEIQDGRLMVFLREIVQRTEDYQKFLERASQIARALERARRRDPV